MTKTTLIEGFEREIKMRQQELQNEINAATDRLVREAKSIHLGHNLSSHASAISVITGKIELAETALRSIKELA